MQTRKTGTKASANPMNSYGCINDLSDEDCNYCAVYGYMFNGCPYKCEHYKDQRGRGWTDDGKESD